MSRDLLFSITKKDLDIQFFSGTGAGGQYRNKHQNCVRLRHRDSGVIVTGQSNRERPANIKEAFKNLMNNPQFKVWYYAKIQEVLSGLSIEDRVREQMDEVHIFIEGKNKDGRWEKLINE